MTLNSVDWSTEVLIRNTKTRQTKIIQIGQFIDELIKQNSKDVQHLGDNLKEEMGEVEYLDIKNMKIYIPSVDVNGKVSFKLIEAVTKHLPINLDGTNTLVKIKTRMGREVIATKAKSFLTRINNKIVPIRGDEIKVGTFLPITKNFATNIEYNEYYDLIEHFPKNKFTYGSEIQKAGEFRDKCASEGNRFWWSQGRDKEFITPHVDPCNLVRMFNGARTRELEVGVIYPKQWQNTKSIIPEKIKLDKTFGFIVGAYVAEGWVNGDTVGIANNNADYRESVKEFSDKYGIGHYLNTRLEGDELSPNPKYSLELHSILLSTLLEQTCGKLAPNKQVPDFAYTAPDEFVKGFLDGYISGDGNVYAGKSMYVGMSSVSKKLIIGLSTLLNRVGIISKVSSRSPRKECRLPHSKLEKLKQQYTLVFRNENIKKFNDFVTLVIDYKQENLTSVDDRMFLKDGGMFDKIPGNEIISIHVPKISNMDDIKHLVACHANKIDKKELKILQNAINSDVYYDDIVSIEEVEPSNTYVYDFTVADTKNFCIANGLHMRDSFHHAGIASMSATVQGVPRMKELLSVSKNPKTPQMVIYLTPEYMGSKDMAHKIASHIKYTTLGDTRGRINVYYDPKPMAKGSYMEQDNVKTSNAFSKGDRGGQMDVNSLPWLMRIELDREKMLEKEVTLLEIKSKFRNWWEKRFNDTKVVKGEEKKVLNKINQLEIYSNSDNDKQPVLHIRFNVKDGEKDKFNMGTIDNFIDLIIDKFKLKGLNSIVDIPAIQEERLLSINPETGNEDKLTHHVIYATGVNLLDIRYFNGVDLNKTITNNIMDVYETFGIEIARAVLMKEIIGAYSNAGGEVNYQHVTMIVDQMTSTGQINSIDRHGMNKSDSDPLARASFEKTVEQLLIASVYGETDYMRSVSSRIMAGAVIKGGTGFCEVEFDTDLVEKSEHVEGTDYSKKFNELHESTLAKDIVGKKDEDIFIPI